MEKETGLIIAYRAVLVGVTNGRCIHELGLGAVYRTRISDLRIMMDEKYGLGPKGSGKGWLPRKQLLPLKDNIYYWLMIIPLDADARDPLGLLNLPPEQKVVDTKSSASCNQLEMFHSNKGGDHESLDEAKEARGEEGQTQEEVYGTQH